MLRFDPLNPYPLLLPGVASYAEDQAHGAAVDAWLGIRAESIEAALVARNKIQRSDPDQQLWIGLPVQAMLTPYTELRAILAEVAPKPGQSIVDLGAGYGRMGFVIAKHHPGVRFLGYEYVVERVHEGARCLEAATVPENVELKQADLSHSEFLPEAADFYFIYDYGTPKAIAKTLEDLKLIARSRAIKVIGRGRSSRDAIEREQPWLSQIIAPEHHGHYSIYRSGR